LLQKQDPDIQAKLLAMQQQFMQSNDPSLTGEDTSDPPSMIVSSCSKTGVTLGGVLGGPKQHGKTTRNPEQKEDQMRCEEIYSLG